MSVKLQVWARKTKKEFSKNLYKMMRPLANYLFKRQDRKYKKATDSITQEQAVKWIAEDLVKYIVKYNRSMYLIIADYIDDEDLSGYTCLNFLRGSEISRGKTKRAYYKFDRDIDYQIKVLTEIKVISGVMVESVEEDFGWREQSIRNLHGLYKISIEGSRD